MIPVRPSLGDALMWGEKLPTTLPCLGPHELPPVVLLGAADFLIETRLD